MSSQAGNGEPVLSPQESTSVRPSRPSLVQYPRLAPRDSVRLNLSENVTNLLPLPVSSSSTGEGTVRDKPGAGWISCRPPVLTAGDTAHPWKASQREEPALCAPVTLTLTGALYVLWGDNRKLNFLAMIMRKPKLFSALKSCP